MANKKRRKKRLLKHPINPKVYLDYYQRPLEIIHKQVALSTQNQLDPHPIRQYFWQSIPAGEYSSYESQSFLKTYLSLLKYTISEAMRPLSLAYIIHLYRRLSPGPIGHDTQPMTILLTRSTLDVAAQKYSRFDFCKHVSTSDSIPVEKVMGGLLASPEFELERKFLAKNPQVVLADFTLPDMMEFYDIEKLCFEVWRTTAGLRITSKGAGLVIDTSPECYEDNRSDELDYLVKHYDERLGKMPTSSATGTVYSDFAHSDFSGCVFLPIYNVAGITGKDLRALLSGLYHISVPPDSKFNFFWHPFDLRDFRRVHLPFSEAFLAKYSTSFDAVLSVLAAFLIYVKSEWSRDIGRLIHYWQRGYGGPYSRQQIDELVTQFLPEACILLGIDPTTIALTDIKAAISFWELTDVKRQEIGLEYPGPHYVILPITADQYFLDYVGVVSRLHYLFYGVTIPDQNFKGTALEQMMRREHDSLLPEKECFALDGTAHQVDYAIACGSILVIAECKVVSHSLAFERGDLEALKYRTEHVIETGLNQVDTTAKWLASNPVGRNYDISQFSHILPIVISPFVEFIPSVSHRYWIAQGIPRVLTPDEFENILKQTDELPKAYNLCKIS